MAGAAALLAARMPRESDDRVAMAARVKEEETGDGKEGAFNLRFFCF